MIGEVYSQTPDDGARRAPAKTIPRLLREVADLFGDPQPLPEVQIDELARAVEIYLARQSPVVAVDSADGLRGVVLLTSRAVASLGESGVARRLLVHSTGLVRPALWEVLSGRSMWVLDLRHLAVPSDAPLELVLFRSLDMVLRSIAELWDGTHGQGTLGLRRVCRTAAELLQAGTRTPAARDLAREIRGRCEMRLAALGPLRGWTAIPAVLNLDF